MQTDVLDQIDDPLHAYVVWVPILPDDAAPPGDALSLVSDARAAHFWDRDRLLPAPFAHTLGLPQGWPAWDVYLAYPAGARWDHESPPAPAFWHHQLGDEPRAPKLDGPLFARRLREMMAKP